MGLSPDPKGLRMTAMMEELVQQPAALAGLRKYYESPGAIPRAVLRRLATKRPPTVIVTGMGSSFNAAYPAQAYLAAHGIRAVVWETAELLHHHLGALRPDTLLVVVSQSGETVEVVRLLDRLPKDMKLAAVVNVDRSTLARRANLLLPMMAGAQSTVSTKTYMCSVAVLMYLAFAIANKPQRHLTRELIKAIRAEERILDRRELLIEPTIEFFNHPTYVALMSRGPDLASALQGALLLKETVRLAAEPMSAAQFRHGPIEILNPSHRYVIFARESKLNGARQRGTSTGRLLLRLARDLQAHGGRVILLTELPFPETVNVRTLRVEPIQLGLGTLIDTLYMQLLAHDLAQRAGLEPGKFWIAEGVTREE
jgi:glutamine---fructose-6-phosphate transaminase (isomerizing)